MTIQLTVHIGIYFICQTDELLLYYCLASLAIVFKGWVCSYKLDRAAKDVVKLEVAAQTIKKIVF